MVAFGSEQRPTVQSANQNEHSGTVVAFGSKKKSILQSMSRNENLGDIFFFKQKFVELIFVVS